MAFVVDGSEWKFDGWTELSINEVLEKFLEVVWSALDRSEKVWIGEELQYCSVLGDLNLWDLRSPDSPVTLSQELWEELSAWLGRDCCYLTEDWPEGMLDTLIQIGDGAPLENVDVAWAHHNVRAGHAVGCLGLRRIGVYDTISSEGRANIRWVTDEVGHRAFWRDAIDVEGDNERTLRRLAQHAFPDLYFHSESWAGLGRLSGGYLAQRAQVRRHLAVLDDYGYWAFTCPPPALAPHEPIGLDSSQQPSNQIIERRFHGLNLNMSPENPNVFRNTGCREAREVGLGGQTLYCEWHAKFELHQNRLHVYKPTPVSNNKVVIAIFDSHLPLP
jgi:hypothetical protein